MNDAGVSLLNESGGIALLCDEAGRVLRILRDDLGLGSRVAAGRPFTQMFDVGSLEKARNFLAALADHQAAFDWELNVPDGERIVAMRFAGAVTDEGLFVIGAKSLSEITRFYEELAQVNNEQTNALRDALKSTAQQARSLLDHEREIYELTRLNNEFAALQRELAKKNFELERLVEQMNQFLGMAAHDLRNPLGVILMISRYLLGQAQTQGNQQQAQFIDRIISSTEFMLRLVNDLLDISKIEAGKLQLDLRPVDLMALIEQNLALNRMLADKKAIALQLVCDQDAIPRLILDPSKIEQVLNNLISNAVKFSPPNSRVEVRLSVREDEAVISVKDQGPGVSVEEAEKIFDPFKQAKAKGTAGESGVGLGLAIAKKIVSGHSGKIWVASEPGQGATFYVSLPLSRAGLAASE